MVDLRKDKRAPASLKVKYKSATVDEFIEQFGNDVSRGGVFIKTKKPIENGALLKLELQLSDASPVIAGIGRVCWRREAAPDPSLPAGMGIKLIKLDPDSRAIIDRIVEGRGAKPSRFDQTQGAQVASASEPPPADTGSLAPVPAVAAAMPPSLPSAPAPAPKPAAPLPAPPAAVVAPRVSAARHPGLPPPPAIKASLGARPPAAKVAGLFADSPLVRNAAPEPRAEGSRPSSFFPPAPNAFPFGAAPRASAASAPDNRLTPPPPAIGSVPPPSPTSSLPPAARASQARQSGQFLAAAFAEGGLAEETASQARAAAQTSEDELIDELFAGVVDDEPATRSVPAPPPSGAPRPVETTVDDVFAALSEEEGLSEPPAHRRSSTPSPSAPRASALAGFGDADEATTKEMPSLRPPAGQATSRDELADGADAFGDDENFGEADLFASQVPPAGTLGARASGGVPALPVTPQQQPAAAKRSSMLPIVLLVLLALGGAGAYLYYQRYVAPADEPPQASETPAPSPAAQPATAAEPQPAVPGPAPGQPPTPTAAAQPQAQGAPPAPAAVPTPEQTVEVEVSSLPRDSDIAVGGKKVGTTPKHISLPIGREAHVTVSAAGYAAVTKSVVASASTEPLRFKLEPLPFTLVVRSTPPEATLWVGRITATSPAPLELGHVEGGVQVSIAKDGFQRMTRLVRFDEFAEKNGVMRAEIEVTLNPLPGVPSAPFKARAKRPHGTAPSEAPPPPEPGAPSPPEAETSKPAAAPPNEPALEKPAPAASKPLPEGRPPEPAAPSPP